MQMHFPLGQSAMCMNSSDNAVELKQLRFEQKWKLKKSTLKGTHKKSIGKYQIFLFSQMRIKVFAMSILNWLILT